MTRCKVVAAVEHDAHARHRVEQGVARQPMRQGDHLDAGVGLSQRLAPRFGLEPANAVVAVQDLALQIGQIDRVAVSKQDASDACTGQIKRCRRPQPSGTHHQRARGQQPLLRLDADVVEQDVPAVAKQLLVVHAYFVVLAFVPASFESADDAVGSFLASMTGWPLR